MGHTSNNQFPLLLDCRSALPTETRFESGTSQSKSGTFVWVGNTPSFLVKDPKRQSRSKGNDNDLDAGAVVDQENPLLRNTCQKESA